MNGYIPSRFTNFGKQPFLLKVLAPKALEVVLVLSA